RSGPQQVKLDSVEAIELAEVVIVGNVIGNSAGETCGCRHAVDGVSQRSATPRRAPTWLHHAVDQARLPQISLGITHRRGPKSLRWGRLSQTAEALD
ncbi:MAG: hypothetical protein QOJ15_8469, partial [Bradyrhizobium sp.]|nr:hypothetical protein [Bradyrhizobium sp.]